MPPDKPSNSPSMAFILDYLKKNGDAEYAIIRAAAEKAGHSIYPIMYGRAKTLLGMITEESRSRRRRRRKEDETGTGDAGGTRPLRQSARSPMSEATANQLSSFLERYRELEGERNRYRAALLQVEKMLRQVLEETS